VAFSKKSWLEATGAVYQSVVLMVLATIAITLVLVAVNIDTALTDSNWTRGPSWDYACRTCSDGEPTATTDERDRVVASCILTGSAPLNVCFFSWHARLVFPFAVVGQLVSLILVSFLTPLRVWDPIAVEAAERTRESWLQRVRVMHFAVLPALAFVAVPLSTWAAMEYYVASRSLVEVVGIVSSVCSVYQLVLVVWMLHSGHRKRQGFDSAESTRRRHGIFSSRVGVVTAVKAAPAVLYRSLFAATSSGLNNKLLHLLVLTIYVFAAHDSGYGIKHSLALASIRLGVVVMFLLAHDQTCDFTDLRADTQGPGFGLLVDAVMLREALQRHLAGSTPLLYIPEYKATVYRMEAAMTGAHPLTYQSTSHLPLPQPCIGLFLP
jgi:hypothetical protein